MVLLKPKDMFFSIATVIVAGMLYFAQQFYIAVDTKDYIEFCLRTVYFLASIIAMYYAFKVWENHPFVLVFTVFFGAALSLIWAYPVQDLGESLMLMIFTSLATSHIFGIFPRLDSFWAYKNNNYWVMVPASRPGYVYLQRVSDRQFLQKDSSADNLFVTEDLDSAWLLPNSSIALSNAYVCGIFVLV